MQQSDISILCVDDSAMVHKFVKSKLAERYKKLNFANDGLEGIAAYKKFAPNIVISDINMPKMNGLEMVKRIKKINPKAIIVMLSTESGKSFILKAAESGVSGFINKNNARVELVPTVDKLAKLIVKQSKQKKVEKNPYEHLQAFLELSSEMCLLSDGVNIFSCNKLFLDFLNVDSVHNFIANYASIEYLVETIEGIDDERLNSNHWIEFLLGSKEGKKVTILNYQTSKRITLIAKVAKIPDEKELYAIVFSEIQSKESSNSMVVNFFTQTLSQQLFTSQLPLFLQNAQSFDVAITLISFRLANIESDDVEHELLLKVVEMLHKSTSAQDLIYSYEKGFIIACLASDVTKAKLKAKVIADGVKAMFTPKRVHAKLGFVALNNVESKSTDQEKIMDYLTKFYYAKLIVT